MKEIKIGNQLLNIKDYYCADNEENYIERDDNRLWLYINITDACNASCPFCVNPSNVSCSGKFSVSKLKNDLKNISQYVYGVSITGGEPMLNPELVDDVASAVIEVLGSGIELNLVTNGVNLDRLPSLKMLDYFESIHISRHKMEDAENSTLMGFDTPTISQIKSVVDCLEDPAKIVFNCVLQKGGVSDVAKMADYLEMASWAGVKNTSFVGFFMANQFCKDNYVHPASIASSFDKRFTIWNRFNDYDYCSCSSGDYRAKNGYVRFYFRCPGNKSANYCRQLVYTADNRLLDGFGGEVISFENM